MPRKRPTTKLERGGEVLADESGLIAERAEAERRYRNQVKIVDAIQQSWEDQGCPVTHFGGSTGTVLTTHPTLLQLQEAEALADRLLKTLREKRPVGRPRGTGSAPDRAKQPAARVRKLNAA